MKRFSDTGRIISYLHKFGLTELFSEELVKHMELFVFSKGELVCRKGCESKYIFLLVEGRLKTYNLYSNGRSLLISFNSPLSIFGDVELFSDLKFQCNVETLSESTLITVEAEKVRKYAGNDPDFLKFILRYVSDKLSEFNHLASLNLLYSLDSRLASYLLSLINDSDETDQGQVVVIPKLIELAQMLGSSYRHLSRTINELISKDIIEKDRSKVTVKDISKLKELSQCNVYR